MSFVEIRRTGPSLAALSQEIGGIPARVLPYATATALTKAAKRGQLAVIAQMRSSFANPVAYTLNSTRVEVATADKLFARIAIKDAGSGGARPTSYLLPEVEGGGRSMKGMERALSAAGLLLSGERVMPGASAALDSNGNVSGATVRSILRQVSAKRSTGGVFIGAVGRRQTRGVWKRDGKRLLPLFIFTRKLPRYTPRLDFVGAAATAVRDGFASDFYDAAQSLQRKFA